MIRQLLTHKLSLDMKYERIKIGNHKLIEIQLNLMTLKWLLISADGWFKWMNDLTLLLTTDWQSIKQ